MGGAGEDLGRDHIMYKIFSSTKTYILIIFPSLPCS